MKFGSNYPSASARNCEVDYINNFRILEYAKQHNRQLLIFKSSLRMGGITIPPSSWLYRLLEQESETFTQAKCQKINSEFVYCEGAPYMILETPKDGGISGSVNGNIGKAVGIILNPKELPSSARIRVLEHPPHAILLSLQTHTLQKKLTGLEEFPVGTVPIQPSLGNSFNINLPLINKNWYKLSWPDSESNLRVRRFGFKVSPAFAFTDFKCQASTHSRLACNTLQCPGQGPPISPGTSAYVMISRCVLLQGLLFLQPVTRSIRKDPSPALIAEQIRLRQIERETLIARRQTIDQLMTDLTTLQRDIKGQNKSYIWVKESLLHISQLISNLKKLQFDPTNPPPKVATCISCLEICLSDYPQPRCYECLKDKVPALSPQTCISCSGPCPCVNTNNTRRKLCDNCCELKTTQSKKRRFSSLLKGTSNSRKNSARAHP